MIARKLSLLGGTVVVATIFVILAAKLVTAAEVPVPQDFSYEETKPLDPVPFSHKFHVTEKKLQCPECHTKVFQMKSKAASPEMTMTKLNAGEFCGKCHDGKKAFATKEAKDCARCHIKK
jgi:c(7)-type cytochrome triheme protein